MSSVLQSLHCAQCGASPLTDNGDGTISCPYCGSAFAHPERVCPQCEAVNEAGARCCTSCGEVLRKPCARCGTLNWALASHCQNCGDALGVLEHLALRSAETTADRLHRLQHEAPEIKAEAERASQARLDQMWARDQVWLDAVEQGQARQQRQERLIWMIAAATIVLVLIAILALAVIPGLVGH